MKASLAVSILVAGCASLGQAAPLELMKAGEQLGALRFAAVSVTMERFQKLAYDKNTDSYRIQAVVRNPTGQPVAIAGWPCQPFEEFVGFGEPFHRVNLNFGFGGSCRTTQAFIPVGESQAILSIERPHGTPGKFAMHLSTTPPTLSPEYDLP